MLTKSSSAAARFCTRSTCLGRGWAARSAQAPALVLTHSDAHRFRARERCTGFQARPQAVRSALASRRIWPGVAVLLPPAAEETAPDSQTCPLAEAATAAELQRELRSRRTGKFQARPQPARAFLRRGKTRRTAARSSLLR